MQMKVIIIGDSSVGKSCLLQYYLRNTCKLSDMMANGSHHFMVPSLLTIMSLFFLLVNHKSKHTVGVEFGQKFIRVNDRVVKL